jgi:hypothetical protein
MTGSTGHAAPRERASRLDSHATVISFRQRPAPLVAAPEVLEHDWLRQICLEAGADDAGFVEVSCPEISDQRADILGALPRARTLVSFVRRMNRENIRTPARLPDRPQAAHGRRGAAPPAQA